MKYKQEKIIPKWVWPLMIIGCIFFIIGSIGKCAAKEKPINIGLYEQIEPFHQELGSTIHLNFKKIGLYCGLNADNDVYGLQHQSYQLGLSYRFKTIFLVAGYQNHKYTGFSPDIRSENIHNDSIDIGIITRKDTLSFIAITDILNRSTKIGIGLNLRL